jgi:hypothetical protein
MMMCVKCSFDNAEHIRFCGMCGTRINELFSSTDTVISNIRETTPVSDDLPNPAMFGFISKGHPDGAYSPREDASSSQQRLSAMDAAAQREPDEWARQTQERLEWIVEAFKPDWAIEAPSSGATVCLTVPVIQAPKELQFPVEERERPPRVAKEDAAAHPVAAVSRRPNQRVEKFDERLRAELGASEPSLLRPGIDAEEPFFKRVLSQVHWWHALLLMNIAVLIVLGTLIWRASHNDGATTLTKVPPQQPVPTIPVSKPAEAKGNTPAVPHDRPAIRHAIPSRKKAAPSIPANTSVTKTNQPPPGAKPSGGITLTTSENPR